jgi:cysteine desulfurase
MVVKATSARMSKVDNSNGACSNAAGMAKSRPNGSAARLTLSGAASILSYQEAPPMRVYLDNNATTPVDREVLDAMLPYFGQDFGNASSIHSVGQQARGAVERARESVAALLGAKPAEIVFTSGGTEADNLAIFGVVAAVEAAKKHVITTQIEHHAVLNTCQALERQGVAVSYLPVGRDGVVNPDEVRRALRPETVLITVMHANNELGTIQPIEEIGRIAAEADVWFHTDAVQSAGKLPLDAGKLGADLLSISAHKIYGPKGVGALFVRAGTPLEPQFHGGHHERDRRPGTENVPGIAGLGKAAELARARLSADAQRLAKLRDRLEEGLLGAVPQIRVNGSRSLRVPNTANLTISYAEGESLVIALDLKGVACSTGAACSSGAVEPSHVLTAVGLPPEDARASIRFSLGRCNTAEEVEFALGVIPGVVEHLRDLSPAYQKPVSAR